MNMINYKWVRADSVITILANKRSLTFLFTVVLFQYKVEREREIRLPDQHCSLQSKVFLWWQVHPPEEVLYPLKHIQYWNYIWYEMVTLMMLMTIEQIYSPPPPTPASEISTKPRPNRQTPAPRNCLKVYLAPRNIQVRIITQAIVQQSNIVTLVIDEYWYALLSAKKQSFRKSLWKIWEDICLNVFTCIEEYYYDGFFFVY